MTFAIHIFGDIKHFEIDSDSGMCTHINCITKHQEIAPKLSLSKNDEIHA